MANYRDLGGTGHAYPQWVRDLKEKNGAYVIRENSGERRILYVGESHTGRLYETMTRHFQRWGLPEANSYTRSRVEAAVHETSADDAPAVQRELIARLEPRDNVYETEPTDADVPF